MAGVLIWAQSTGGSMAYSSNLTVWLSRDAEFYNTPGSYMCASNTSAPTQPSPTSAAGDSTSTNRGCPTCGFRVEVRCSKTLPGTRYVTLQFWRGTADYVGFGELQVLRGGG